MDTIKTHLGTVGISDFVRRQTKESRFSYFDGSDEDLLELIRCNIYTYKAKYRPDVLGVTILPTDHFYSGIVEMQEGDKIVGSFSARKEGEEPRVQTGVVGGKKIPAQFVEIILYSRAALAENDENSIDADWEIISINASPTTEEVPLRPMTLIANHFGLDGGTATGLNEKEFVELLKKSVAFWKNKGMVADGKQR